MKTKSIIHLAAALLLATFGLQPSTVLAQGSLTPPGAPAPTMKSLNQIEPRIPIDALHTPGDVSSAYIISNSGSYYLTTNLNNAIGKSYMITIMANNVTVDLGGFSLLGNSTTFYGIAVPNFQTNVIVRNGFVSGFASYGVYCANVYYGGFNHLTVSQNNYAGLACGRKGLIQDCLAVGNVMDGFYVFGYSMVQNCVATDNNATGIHVLESGSRIEGNHVVHNGIGVKVDAGGNLIIRNSATGSVTNNYSIAAGNVAGPSVNAANIATNSNPHANYDF